MINIGDMNLDKDLFKKKFAANLVKALEYLEIPKRDRSAAIRDAIKKALGKKPSDQAIRQWLEGSNTPSNYNLVAMCDELNLSVAFLLTGRGPIMAGEQAVDVDGSPLKITVLYVPVLLERDVKAYIQSGKTMDLSGFDKVVITNHYGPETFAIVMPDNSMTPLIQKGAVVAVDPNYPGMEDLQNCDKPVVALDDNALITGKYRSGKLLFDNDKFEPHTLSEDAKIIGCIVRITEIVV